MRFLLALLLLFWAGPSIAQETILLRPARVFDGVNAVPHEGWQVLVRGDRFSVVRPRLTYDDLIGLDRLADWQ